MLETPTLFLVIDAIPHAFAAEAWATGAMPGFCRPRRMISTFPSLTHVAVPTLLRGVHDIRPPGYEARYFHPPSGELRGGLGDPESEAGFAQYHTLFARESGGEGALQDLAGRGRGLLGHLAVYLLRRRLVRREVQWVRWRFRRAGAPWLGYLSATDGVGHFGGEAQLRASLRDILAEVVDARTDFARTHGVLPNVVLCSDHGMAFDCTRYLDLETVTRMLGVGGFSVGPDGVMLAPMGDISVGAAWCRPEDAPAVAELLAVVEGVELAAARTASGLTVFRVTPGRLAVADVTWSAGRYRYTPRRGDPLELVDLIGTDWVDDRAVLEATAAHRYPDPLHRLRGGLTDLVQWPGQVLFSMADGWTFGARLTHMVAEAMGGQVGTHGALSRTQTTGFLAAAGLDLPDGPVRAESVFAPWHDAIRQG